MVHVDQSFREISAGMECKSSQGLCKGGYQEGEDMGRLLSE